MTAQAHIDAIPSRARPFEKTQQPTPALLRKLLGRDLAPSQEEFTRCWRRSVWGIRPWIHWRTG